MRAVAARGCAGAMLTLAFAVPTRVWAQPAEGAEALKAALEGRHVTVLIDMPATSGGVDLYPQREPDIDAPAHGYRLKEFGTAIRRGQRVPITFVKVTKKNIELHLAGGGYGVRGDPVAIPLTPYIGKSTRERDLERERDRTRDPARKREIERELRGLADDRAREQVAAMRTEELRHAAKAAEIAKKRLERGSRINVWYPDKRLERWVPSAEDLTHALAQYLDFTDPRLTSLKRGMKIADVYTLLGFPDFRRPTREGEFDASLETWRSKEGTVDVLFVNGLVVKVTTGGR